MHSTAHATGSPPLSSASATQQPTLLKTAIVAGIWTLAGHGSSQILRLAGNLLLTRLLAPEFFGVMSIAMVITVGVGMFSDLGLRQVLVRSNQADDPVFVNTVWTLQVLQALAMSGVLVVFAACIAWAQHRGLVPTGSTYASTDLPAVVIGLSLSVILGGFESTRLATAEKELRLRPVVTIELASQAAGLLAMAAAALVHPSIYVLLLGGIVSNGVRVAASHRIPCGVSNRFAFSHRVARQVCHVSVWILVSSGLTFLSGNLDKVVLAGLLGAASMGHFAIAALLVNAIFDLVAKVSGKVAFPAITKAYERNRAGLARSYQRARLPIDCFCLLAGAFLFWFGPDVVRLMYDARYSDAGWMLGILSVTLLGARYSVVSYVYLLLGRTSLMAAEQAIRLVAVLVGIAIGYALAGTRGAIWGAALGQLSGPLAGLLLFQRRLGIVSIQRELAAIGLFVAALSLFGLIKLTMH
ncbi:oligosaccharide flippase family protein [Ramlibacter ginsenosidimutans]|uniref:Oligosaccharide flippase family protein n=1 Tax=Ramlibacter ginsenosidimutans TaxID=502333 RepID=A0A934WJY2_9BURK|nr:oligosaccharide flippase family protein [Ramlibacter ginsenosidimutans]MBK6005164.1 oligosaccharide flippase family protein [Ramlibacter ginsenosidimutans]